MCKYCRQEFSLSSGVHQLGEAVRSLFFTEQNESGAETLEVLCEGVEVHTFSDVMTPYCVPGS